MKAHDRIDKSSYYFPSHKRANSNPTVCGVKAFCFIATSQFNAVVLRRCCQKWTEKFCTEARSLLIGKKIQELSTYLVCVCVCVGVSAIGYRYHKCSGKGVVGCWSACVHLLAFEDITARAQSLSAYRFSGDFSSQLYKVYMREKAKERLAIGRNVQDYHVTGEFECRD